MCQRLVRHVPSYGIIIDRSQDLWDISRCCLRHNGHCYHSPEFRILTVHRHIGLYLPRAHDGHLRECIRIEFRRRANLAGHRGRNIVSTARK